MMHRMLFVLAMAISIQHSSAFISRIKDKYEDVKDKAAEHLDNLTLGNLEEGIKDVLEPIFQGIPRKVKAEVGGIIDDVKTTVVGVVEEVEDTVNDVRDGIEDVVDEVHDVVDKIQELPAKIGEAVAINFAIFNEMINDPDVRDVADTLRDCMRGLASLHPAIDALMDESKVAGAEGFAADLKMLPYLIIAIPISKNEVMSSTLHKVCASIDIVMEAKDVMKGASIAKPAVAQRSVSATSNKYVHVGCYKDRPYSKKRAMTRSMGKGYDVDKCYVKCSSLVVYEAFGVQKNDQCWCGLLVEDAKKYGKTTTCKNGRGGSKAIDVYEINFGSRLRMAHLRFKSISTIVGTICDVIPERVTQSVCANIRGVFTNADVALVYAIEMYTVWEDDIAKINMRAIVANQVELRGLITTELVATPSRKPNMIHIEMSFEELAMKCVATVLVGLFVGLLIGHCAWNTNKNASYKPVKFVNEEAGNETECE